MFPPRRMAWSRVLTSFLPATPLLAPRRIGTRCLLWSGLTSLVAPPMISSGKDKVGILANRWPLAHLLYALVGSMTSFVDVVSNLQAQSATGLLAHESPCFPPR